jgi:peptidoglycan hydrolase-like protein with peptidoglycan-binding domain
MPSDPEVKKAQQRLICRCYLHHGDDDGILGPVTHHAVYLYQLFRSPGHPWAFNIPLVADGILGPNTKGRLNPPQIKQDNHGQWVTLCQSILTRLAQTLGGNPAWDPQGIDGDFGPKTDAAVKAFQGDHTEPPAPKGNGKQLAKDGIVGPITWCALNS